MRKLKHGVNKHRGFSVYVVCILLALSSCGAETVDERDIDNDPAQSTEVVSSEDETAAVDSEPPNPANGDSPAIDSEHPDEENNDPPAIEPEPDDGPDYVMPMIEPTPPRYFVTSVETAGIFIRSEANNRDKSNIVLRIEAGDKSVKLKDTGDTEFNEGFVWRRVELPAGGYGWAREDVVCIDGDPGEFKVNTEYRYWHYDENYDFSKREHDYILFSPLEINLRIPRVSADVPDAASVNAEIDKIYGEQMEDTLRQLKQDDFSFVDDYRVSRFIINYEVHRFKNLYALVVEFEAFGPDRGGEMAWDIYYYDAARQVGIDAKTYAESAGLSEEFILSEGQKISEAGMLYYYPETIKDLSYYIRNDGRLCIKEGFYD
jgi:hypothetical protein